MRNFVRLTTNAEIAASGYEMINLEDYRSEFGGNFNTLTIINTDANANIKVSLDGKDISKVLKNNGSLSFDWRDGIIYNSLKITNLSAADVVEAENLYITVGITGVGK